MRSALSHPIRAVAVSTALLAALAGSAAWGAGRPQTAGSHRLPSSTELTSATTQAASTYSTPRVTKLLVFIIENHSLSQMRDHMPWTYALAKRYAYARDYHAIRHPSLPNYLAIAGGSTFGVADDKPPSAHHVHAWSVFDQALYNGRTAKVYAEGMPSPCALQNGGGHYAVRHNPWTYFVDRRPACRAHDVSLASFAHDAAAGSLPNAGMVIPNLIHDAHDASLADADRWLKTHINEVRSGPDFRSGRLAVVVTADEDDGHHGNRVLTVVAGRYTPHRVVPTRLSHYSLTRLYDDVLGVQHLRKASSAHSMTRAFGIRVRAR
ncbi:MAG: alkaline phosphatase family protein [Marmoricola sp.]